MRERLALFADYGFLGAVFDRGGAIGEAREGEFFAETGDALADGWRHGVQMLPSQLLL